MFFLALFLSGSTIAADSSLFALENALSELIFNVSRSVVTIEASRPFSDESGSDPTDPTMQQFVFSGLVYNDSGLILAPASAVAGSKLVIVRFDGKDYPARIIATDYLHGVSLLDAGCPLGRPVVLSEQHGCAGQMIVAMGNSYGMRACPSIGFCAGTRPDGSMQFSATTTPGAIGGGLFDLTGKLVGVINDGIGQGNMAEVGLAVPVSQLPEIVHHLITRGDRTSGYIGLTTADIEVTPGIEIDVPYRFASFGSKRYHTIDRGVLITQVIANSPAAHAGLRRGDLLYSVNGRALNSAVELMDLIRKGQPGMVIELGLVRQNRPQLVRIAVGSRRQHDFGNSSASDRQEGTLSDSLRREINSLRKALQNLERRLPESTP